MFKAGAHKMRPCPFALILAFALSKGKNNTFIKLNYLNLVFPLSKGTSNVFSKTAQCAVLALRDE